MQTRTDSCKLPRFEQTSTYSHKFSQIHTHLRNLVHSHTNLGNIMQICAQSPTEPLKLEKEGVMAGKWCPYWSLQINLNILNY